MKKKIVSPAIYIGFLLLVFWGCGTDVPISFSTKITDTRIVGYWQERDSSAIVVQKTAIGTVTLQSLRFDREKGEYVPEDEAVTLYFTPVSDSKGVLQFISTGANSQYSSFKFYFNANGDLVTAGLSDDFLQKHSKVMEDKAIFGTPEQFKKFIKNNMRYKALYEEESVFIRKRGLADLAKP